jgi:acyl transferase domain-containing protein
VGELAAAHVAGVMTIEDACRVVAARGRLMQALPSGGAMVAVRASLAQVTPLLGDGVAVAAVNGPNAVVLSGDSDAVLRAVEALGVKNVRLQVSHAFHSPHMDPMLAEYRAVLKDVKLETPQIPIVSTVSGSVEADWTSPDYWVSQVREPVRFYGASQSLQSLGVSTMIELGPDAVLSTLTDVFTVPMLRAKHPEPLTAITALGHLFARGVAVDWPRYFAGTGAKRVSLPTYAFRRDRYWLSSEGASIPAARQAAEPVQVASIEELVRSEVAAVLGFADAGRVDDQKSFQDLGFDSMTAVGLRNRLSTALGTTLPATMVFDHPTPAALADFIRSTMDSGSSVLDELDRLEATLASLPADEYDAAATRLRAMLAKSEAPELASASADELFAFIDTQLGRT